MTRKYSSTSLTSYHVILDKHHTKQQNLLRTFRPIHVHWRFRTTSQRSASAPYLYQRAGGIAADRMSSTGWTAARPAPWPICWRQETRVAAIKASRVAESTAYHRSSWTARYYGRVEARSSELRKVGTAIGPKIWDGSLSG